MSDVFDPHESIATVRKEDGEWVVFCHHCGRYLTPPPEIGGRDWLSQTSALAAALDHSGQHPTGTGVTS